VLATLASLAPADKQTVLNSIMKVFGLTDLADTELGYETLRGLNR